MNEYGCVYASVSAPAIVLQKITILATRNHLFRWSSFWSWRACKQAKLSHLRHRKPARISWKADALKTNHCLVRILLQIHNSTMLLRKCARRGRYSQWRSLLGHVERICVYKNWRGGNIWFQQDGATCHTAEATLDVLRPVFEVRISVAELMLFGHLGVAIWHRCQPDNWRFKGQYSWSHWWNTAAHNR